MTNDIIDKAQNNKDVFKICSQHQKKGAIQILVFIRTCLIRKCQYIFTNNIVWNINNFGAPDESRSSTLNNFNESVQFRTIMSSIRNTSRICRSYVCVSDHRFRHECLGKIIEQHTQ